MRTYALAQRLSKRADCESYKREMSGPVQFLLNLGRQLTHLNLGAYDSRLTFVADGFDITFGSLG